MALVDLIKGMDFGAGVDLGGQLFGDAVLRTTPTEIVDTGGKTADIFLTLVESQEEQDSALQLSTSVSASYGLFGGSGKFDLSQEMHVHDFALSLVIRATVLDTFTQLRDVQFGKEATDQLANGLEDRFREQFGDMFVRGIQTGGEFVAILQIEGHDENDQSSMRSDLEASGVLGGVALSTSDSFSTHVSHATSGRKTKLRHFQVGGNPVASIDPGEMVKHALTFADEVKAGQKEAFQALLLSYKTVDSPKPPNFIDLENARETIETLMQMRRDALTRLTAFNFVVAHPEQFEIPPTMVLSAIVGRFETAVAKLTSAASRCVNSPKEAPEALTSVAGLDIPTDALPNRRPAPPPPPPPPPAPTVVVADFIGVSAIIVEQAMIAAQLGTRLTNFPAIGSFLLHNNINIIFLPLGVHGNPKAIKALCVEQNPSPGNSMPVGGTLTLTFGPF